MTLKEQLYERATRVPPIDPDEILARARARADGEASERRLPRPVVAVAAAVVTVAVLTAGTVALIGPGSDDTLTATGSDEAGGAADPDTRLAPYLLVEPSIADLFPHLLRVDGSDPDDYSPLSHRDLAGPSAQATRGVTRRWATDYSHSLGDPVHDIVISVASTVVEHPTPRDANDGAELIVDQARHEQSEAITAAEVFDAYCQQPAGAEVRSCVAVATRGATLIIVELSFAGDPRPTESFAALVAAAADRLE